MHWTAEGLRRSGPSPTLCLLLISSLETPLLLLPLNIMKVALGEQCLGGRSGMLIGRAAFSKKPPIPGQLHLSVWNPQPHSMENRKGRPSLI